MKFFAIALFCALNLVILPAGASFICNQIFEISSPTNTNYGFPDIFPQLRDSYPLLARIVTGKVRQRIKNAGPAWDQLETIISSCSSAECSISLNTEKFDFKGGVQIVGDEENNKTMQIDIDYFVASNGMDDSGNSTKIELRKQSKGVNFQFLYLMGTVFSAAHRVMETHPEVKNIRIKGGYVVNKVLAASLKEMGFIATRPTLITGDTFIRFFMKGVFGLVSKRISNIANKSELNPVSVGVKAIGTLGLIFYEYRLYRPTDWTLEIPVR